MSLKKRLLNFFTALIMIFGSTPFVFDGAHAEASVGDEPGHGKTLIDNHDGTYTIALSVTGETDNESVTTTTKANVVLVVDTSNSMNQSSGTTSEYVYTEFTGNGTQGGQYWGTDGDGEYYSVYWRNNADPHWRTSNNNNGPVYSGTVYTRSGGTALSRIEAEKDALTKTNGIIDNLLKQNVPGDSVKSDIIEVSIVNFGTRGSVAQGWTTDATTLKDSINGLSTSTGTNWEEALSNAKTLADQKKASQPNEDVYIIFMTDGEPTTHSGSYNVNTNYASEWGQANDDARGIVSAGYKFYALFTWGSGNSSHYLSSLVQYAYTGSGNSNSTLSSDYEQYFTDASSTEILISALNQIVNDITTGVGYTNVEMTDGVTAMTGSSIKANANGEVTGLRYYRSGGSYSTTANNGLGDEWTDAPEATINSKGEVDWDLGTMVLEDGVTYTIAFTVWPKQESLDLVADLNNGKASYDDLSEDEKAQIIKNGDVYTLKTNTDYPTLTYSTTTTTTINGQTTTVVSDPTTIRIDNPDPVSLAEEKINIRKIWEDGLDDSQRADYGGNVILDFYRGNDVYQADITLNEDNDWELENYISIAPGIMVSSTSEAYQYADTYTADNEYAVLEEGHDYHFIEKNITNHFILNDSEYHPMLVDGVLKNVFYEKDSDGKIVINEIKDLTELTVTNTMKGGIDARKEVYRNEELDSEATDEFTITITIKNSEGGVYKNSDGTEAQYRIIYANGDRSEKRSATNGVVTETIVPGEIIRVQDLDPGAYYVVSEDTSNLPLGYDQEESGEAVYMIAKDGGEEEDFTDEETKTFDNETYYAVEGNASSKGTLKNYYYTSGLTLSKTVDVLNGNEDLIKNNTEFTFNVNVYADETKTEELTDFSQEVKLKDGEEKTIDGIPVGAYYEISEVEADSNGFTTESTNETGTIVKDETSESNFTNTYKVEATETTISVKKNFGSFWHTDLTNPDLTDKFIFILKDSSGEEIARQTVTETLKDDVQFTVPIALGDDEKITDEGKSFSFIVTELEEGFRGGVSRVEEDEDIEITIVATDNGDGTLVVSEPSYSKLEIFNTYSATGELTLEGIKELEGREFAEDESFTLILKDENGEVLLDEDGEQYTAIATANGEVVSFDKPLQFTEEDIDKTFTFYISEDETDLAEKSIEKNSDDAKVLVAVSDNYDGTLGFEVTYSNEKTITNKYTADGEIALSVTKDLVGRDWKEGETFEFTLSGDSLDEDLTATASEENKTATFDTISFTEEDVDKEFTFTISETSELPGGVSKSGDVTATVTVKDNGDGTLEVTASYDNNQTIVNTYEAEKVSVNLVANKEVSGRDWQDGEEFTFGLYDSNHELIDDVTITKGESIEFSGLEYEEVGTFTYTIEEIDTPDYFTTSDPIEVTVEITDNQDGNLEYEISYTNDNDTIINTYSASGEVTLEGIKRLEGREFADGESFTLILKDENGEVLLDEDGEQYTATATVNGEAVSFDKPLSFTEEDIDGTFTFYISEDETGLEEKSIAKTSDDVMVTITVSDNYDGTLDLEVVYNNDKTIVNKYSASGEISLSVMKQLEGRDWKEGETFEFTLSGDYLENDLTATVSKDSQTATFDAISFTEEDIDKEFTFTISETSELPGGVSKSGDVTATVTVKDNGDGTLEVTASYDNNQTIVNTYEAEKVSVNLVANKEVSGRDWQDGETFTFGLYEDGELVEEVTVKKGESIEFSEIEYKEAGTYIYTIEETNTPDYFTASEPVEVTVEITDNQNGNLESEVSYADNNDTIVNTYSASGEATINITKSLVGRDWLEDETFEFTISGEGIEDETVAVSEDEQTVFFSPINYTLDDLGEHTYTISETSELPGGITKSDDIVVTVVVSDNFDGTLSAEISYTDDGTVTNTYEAEPTEFSFVVTKLLEGDITQENADTFYFELVDEEGEVVETIEIKGSGQASFSSIEKSEAGVYSYIIREVAGDTENYEYDTTVYQVTIEVYDDLNGSLAYYEPIIMVVVDEENEEYEEAEDILFVNHYNEPGRGEVEEPEEENPYTYDNISLFVSLYIISLIGFAGSMVVSRKEA